MTKQTINVGIVANDKRGDPLRTAFTKINQNFTELYTLVGTGGADLGDLKISGSLIGTNALQGSGWGGYDINLSPNGEGNAWITIPTDLSHSNGTPLTIGSYSEDGAGVRINTHTSFWNFNNDGTVNTPIATVNLHNGGNQTGQVLQFGNPEQQVIITGPAPATTNSSAQRLIIQGQKATGTGEGGDVYVWGGDGQVDAGDIKIYAGDADSNTEGYGGYVNISGGQGHTQGGGVSITAGYGTVTGGSLTLSAGGGGTTSGIISLNTVNKSWVLSNDGTVEFPSNTLDFGTNPADIKSNMYAELFYQGAAGDWETDPTYNSQSYVWSAYDGVGIENIRGADGDGGPTWDHRWWFKNDGSLKLPANGTIVDSDDNILLSSSTFVDLPNWLMAVAGTNHLPTLNSDYGWDSNGVWFTNSTIGGTPDEGTSYPVRLADSIPANQGVVITVDFDANPTSNDFGIGVWETGTTPVWAWGPASGNVNIGAQYDGTTPVLKAIAGTGVDVEGRYNLPAAGTYRARLTISAPDTDDEITVTLETLNLSGTVLDTISYVEPKFNTSYSIGFAADQDNGTDRTYITNLDVNINNGGTTYDDALTSYNSVGTTSTGHFSFADNTVTITGQDMRFRTTRLGFDVDCDFDVESDDDVFIDAMGNDVSISAANKVLITTATLNMHGDDFYGQENQFIGTWDGTLLTLNVPNGETTLITLLNEYQNDSRPIWLKTASGYTETDNNDPASKTVGQFVTTFEIPLSTTSPVANAEILVMKLYDSINSGTYHEFEFTKGGKLQFPNGGMIEPVGMGWMGVTNGTTGNPVSVIAKNDVGTPRSELNLYNSGTYGNAQIYTSNAPGTPDAVTYTASNSTGSWDANPVSNLNTTGGSGNGLTVDVYQSGSGYAESVTVVNPGNGYVDGETITVTSGNSSATFVIAVSEYSHEWGFTEDGATQLPGSIKGRVQGNTYTDTTIELDVTATINKLTPNAGLGIGNQYHLADGVEGQIMYIALATGGEVAAEYTSMSFDHCRYSNGNGTVSADTDRQWWLPFAGGNTYSGSAILTLVFIDGYWNLPHGWFD